MLVKEAPKTSTTILVRSDAKYRISSSRDPFDALMHRIFQGEITAERGKRFIQLVEERQKAGNPLRSSEWKSLIVELGVSASSYYAMRNKLLGAGLITLKKGEYRISGAFSKDIVDMARWWWTAMCGNDPDSL
ncbi:MAG: hypothetical protein ACXQS2_01410 [Methermicoccaceae archaeon]